MASPVGVWHPEQAAASAALREVGEGFATTCIAS